MIKSIIETAVEKAVEDYMTSDRTTLAIERSMKKALATLLEKYSDRMLLSTYDLATAKFDAIVFNAVARAVSNKISEEEFIDGLVESLNRKQLRS